MRMFTEVGRRAHTHATGVGKAILAQLDDDTVRGIVARAGMPTPTAKSIGDVEELLADLKLIRERGYSIDEEEQELGVRCFAMAVPNAPTPTAISVSGPVSRVDEGFADKAVPIRTLAWQAGPGNPAGVGRSRQGQCSDAFPDGWRGTSFPSQSMSLPFSNRSPSARQR